MTGVCSTASGRWKLLPPLGLVIATFAVYGVTGGFDFLPSWDDFAYVINNGTIRQISWNHVKEAFTLFYVSNYAPLHIVSYMLDYSVWGLDPSWYHLENVLIHALNGTLFYLLLCRIGFGGWRAVAASFIFLFDPVQVETVAWVSQRKTLLAMFFFLSGLHCYHSHLEDSSRLGSYLLAVTSIAAALLSKSVAVIFPAVALFYDGAVLDLPQQSLRRRVPKLLPFVLLAAVAVGLTMVSQAEETGGGRRGFPGGSPLATFFTMVPVVVSYIRECFLPFSLSPYYEVPIRQYPDALFLVCLLILVAVGFAGYGLRRRAPFLFFWFLFFFIALLPVLQIVPIATLKNDRYLYFPLLGFSVLVVAAGDILVRKLRPAVKMGIRVAFVGLLLFLPVLPFRQVRYWRNDLTIWGRAVDVEPLNRFGWLQLAKSYTERGESGKSVAAFNRYMLLRKQYGAVWGFEGEGAP